MAATNGTGIPGQGCDGDFFQDGITNGAEWYPVTGRLKSISWFICDIEKLNLCRINSPLDQH